MTNRSNHAGAFGMDFQTNAGIVLMLANIIKMKSIKLEGNYEDIDIKLSDGKHVLAQAKSVEDATNDFRNVRAYLKKGLETLSDGEHKIKNKTTQLIYITNSPDPFRDPESKPIFAYLPTIRLYSELPPSSKEIIDDYLGKLDFPLDKKKLYIQYLPFEGDEDKERYKFINQEIRDFVGSLRYTSRLAGINNELFSIWNNDIFKNGTRKNTMLALKKEDIIWPVIVFAVSREEPDEEFYSEFEWNIYEEMESLYSQTIDYFTSRYTFFAEVICDYQNYNYKGKVKDRTKKFIKDSYSNYLYLLDGTKFDDDEKAALIQTILYKIIMKRNIINELKQEVNL